MRWKLTLADGEVVGIWAGTKAVCRQAALRELGLNKHLPNGSTFEAIRPRKVIQSVPPFTVVELSPGWYNITDGNERVISADSNEKQTRLRAKAWNKAGRSFPVHTRAAQEGM